MIQFLPSSSRVDTAIWMYYMDANWTDGKKSLTATTQECCEQYWTSPGDNTPQNSSYMATYHPWRKLSKLDDAGYCWRSRDKLISGVLLWTPSHGRAKAGQPARTYIRQLCEDMGCSSEDLLEAMNNREGWRERESGISVLMARQDDDKYYREH